MTKFKYEEKSDTNVIKCIRSIFYFILISKHGILYLITLKSLLRLVPMVQSFCLKTKFLPLRLLRLNQFVMKANSQKELEREFGAARIPVPLKLVSIFVQKRGLRHRLAPHVLNLAEERINGP